MKFKVGDRVRAVKVDDGNTHIIGKTGTVKKNWSFLGVPVYDIEFDKHVNGNNLNGCCKHGKGWTCYENTLEPVCDNNKIVITTDGKTTTAKMYDGKKFVKSAKAKCSPDDNFDFEKGAGIAISRLLDYEFVPLEETLLNTKICIIEGDEHLKTGHIYEIVDGKFQCDVVGNGKSSTFPVGFRLKSIDELKAYLSYGYNSNGSHFSTTPIKFIEVVE